MTRHRSQRWQRTRRSQIPNGFITQRDIMEATGMDPTGADLILFEQLKTQRIIPPNPKPWQWSGVPIWYRADLPAIVRAVAAELERRRQVVRETFTASKTPAE